MQTLYKKLLPHNKSALYSADFVVGQYFS